MNMCCPVRQAISSTKRSREFYGSPELLFKLVRIINKYFKTTIKILNCCKEGQMKG